MPKGIKRKNGQRVYKKGQKRPKRTMQQAVKAMAKEIKGSVVPGVKMSVAPWEVYKTLKTAGRATVTMSANPVVDLAFMINSCHDPFQAIGAPQSAYWDELTNEIYGSYRVWRGVLNIDISTLPVNGAQSCWIIGYISTSATACTTIGQAYQQQGAIKTWLPGEGNDAAEYSNNNLARRTKLEFAFRANDFYSRNEYDYAVYTADPTQVIYCHIVFCTTEGGNFAALAQNAILVELTQYVQFKRSSVPVALS